MEERDAERKPCSHDKVLQGIGGDYGHRGSNGVRDLGQYPVQMEEYDGCKGQSKTPNPQEGQVSVDPAEDHSHYNNYSPCRAKGEVKHTHTVQVDRLWWEVVDGQGRHLHIVDFRGGSEKERRC
jgi:hypothetical protein